MTGYQRIEAALRAAEGPALAAFLTGGYPDMGRFTALLREACEAADVVEIGVPFSDPMADGVTIQRSSRAALEAGATLAGILDAVEAMRPRPTAPLLLMSYLNPLLAFGLERLVARSAEVGVGALIIPDLPLEEGEGLRALAEAAGVGVVQLVTPVTPPERLARLCAASRGFVYAVTVTGVTGGSDSSVSSVSGDVGAYLDRVRALSRSPVMAGFGVRDAARVAALGAHVDGVIVGSALIDAVDRGESPADFLRGLRP